MKKFKLGIGLVLCAALMLTASVPAQATGVTSEAIKEMENQINNAEKEMNNLKGSLSDVKKLVSKLENEKSSLKNYVKELDSTLAVIEDKIADLLAQITQKEADIEETQIQLAQAKDVEETQYESMKERIKCNYEKGEYHFWDRILSANSFMEMLNRITYEEAIAEYEKKKLDEYIANREYIELCEQQLQVEKEYLDAVKLSVENEQAAVEALIEVKKQEIEKYESNISTQEQAIKEYEADIAEQNEIIKQLEKAVEEEKKKLLQNKAPIYDGGTFAFPLESYTRISDNYGWRTHPILNVKQFHNGVDFAAPKGTKIYAAYDGVVVAATYSSTMGNYVMIDHGDGLYTIYMHASKLYVSKDDVVVKGEHIAGVGTTGRSTGNHLHFSVRKNGNYVSPWDYLSK
ncbi:MAG: peptidoglycan DD-metalloendopeptidase family protein [Lachnospiraceae bacterium]|nr:peptidoglycan DD-metalloendopeptidase family protein [Lachnospiraceae bacterium]